MAKKFSIKKVAAGVLAALMVVTALPVSGISAATAKAAESDTVEVYRSYNPNSGEHLFTIDKSEHETVVSDGRDDEGVRWIAPATSKTPIYRSYNPNTGEHLLVPQKEAEWLATQGWTNEGIKMYSDDNKTEGIYRLYNANAINTKYPAASHTYTGDKEEAEWLVAQGWTYDNGGDPVIYAVELVEEEDYSGVVALVDMSGLQTDGTALPTDLLALTYGASLGVPKNIVWYNNGAARGVYTIDGGDITDGFTNVKLTGGTGITIGSNPMASGEWYVTIENTVGQVFTSNSIIITEIGVAVLSDVSIEDDYETARGVTVDTKTDKAILNFTLNKDYKGVIHVYEKSSKDVYKYASGDIYVSLNAADSTTYPAGTFGSKTKASEFTNKEATSASGDGIKYVDSEGAAHYKVVVSGMRGTTPSLTRGTEYVVIFDQDEITSDDLGTTDTKAENLNIVSATMPYVKAPDKIEVVDAKESTVTEGWSAQLYSGENKAVWVCSTANDKEDVVDIELYSNTNSSSENGTKFDGTNAVQSDTVDLGKAVDALGTTSVGTSTARQADGNTDGYVYAEFTAIKGVFGKEKLKLTSASAGIPDAVVTKATMETVLADPKDIKVTFTNLKSKSKVFLLTDEDDAPATAAGNAITAFIDDQTKYVAVMEAEKGAASITFDDVITEIEDKTNGDTYTIVIVPDNQSDYRNYCYTATTTDPILTVKQVVTTYILDRTEGAEAGTATIKFADQYGDAVDALSSAIGTNSTDGIAMQSAATNNSPTTQSEVYIATDGKVTIISAATGATDADKEGDSWYVSLNGKQTLHATAEHVTSNKADRWTLWID